ncbi:alpha/beta fold hydrolase [Roseiterribacter gracilis]|uniref:AB hydrolase-1 domain-containing protein n=1 Tax=Roseiterribacter gracilis TaxID=2812848 RepID=A0A8S8X896_9PROT|nr:hypothetical protein TMPK1_10710 [Rhodospirillales bacterium TMPK1]
MLRIAGGLLGFLLLATPAMAQTNPALLQPHLIDVGNGRRINFHCIGEGAPTIVFSGGGEGLFTNWGKIQPAISALTRTCFYDRAGWGYSDPPPAGAVDSFSITDDLHTVLQKVGITEPVVLVGHSIGAFHAVVYTNRFFNDVAGLVLVDSGISTQELHMKGERKLRDQGINRRFEGEPLRCAVLARAGKLTEESLPSYPKCMQVPAGVTPEEKQYVLHAITGPNWYVYEHLQAAHYFASDDGPSIDGQQELDTRRSYGDLPMIVLTSDQPEDTPHRTKEENEAGKKSRVDAHKAFAARSTRGQWIFIPGSDHFIQKSNPDVVIKVITDVVYVVRDKSK